MRMPIVPVKARRCTLLLALCVCILAASIFWPAIGTFGWHVAHKAKRDYAGYQIAVPPEFIARQSPVELKLIRARTVFSPDLFQISMVTFGRVGSEIDLMRFESVVAKESEHAGSTSPYIFRTAIGETPLACRQKKLPESKNWNVLCLSAVGLSVSYVGDFDGIRDFHAILERTRKD